MDPSSRRDHAAAMVPYLFCLLLLLQLLRLLLLLCRCSTRTSDDGFFYAII